VGEIAARAGICIRSVQNLSQRRFVKGTSPVRRPRRGRKNLTNVVRIMSAEWLTWIKRGPIGCKDYAATKSIDLRKKESRESRSWDQRIHRMNR
jgi:hypothetical protein